MKKDVSLEKHIKRYELLEAMHAERVNLAKALGKYAKGLRENSGSIAMQQVDKHG